MGRQYTLRQMTNDGRPEARGLAALLIVTAAVLVVALPLRPHAHEIPNDVTVHAFVRPEGQRLRLLVRAPIAAMRDILFPKRDDNNIDLTRAEPAVRQAATLWISDSLALYEGGSRLDAPEIIATQISLPSDRSFASYDRALTHTTGPRLAPDTALVWNQALMDVLFEYTIASDRSDFSIHPALARLGIRVVTTLRFLPPGGAERAFELAGDPGLVRLDPRWHQAAWRFVELGFFHILDGTDHLLFLLCLVIPFRRLRPLVLVVTAFTIAHSITLLASAFDLAPDALWFPPFIETAIAASIVYMALENIVGSEYLRRSRWIIALGFGLVHGFGFSFALRQTMQLAGSHVLTSLLAFNIGVELGQLLVLIVLVPALQLMFRYVVAERVGTIILSAIVAHTAWHWMIDRGRELSRFDWPVLTAAGLANAVSWLTVLVIVAGVVWLGSRLRRVHRPAAANTER
jgi:HupE / UreJ protein